MRILLEAVLNSPYKIYNSWYNIYDFYYLLETAIRHNNRRAALILLKHDSFGKCTSYAHFKYFSRTLDIKDPIRLEIIQFILEFSQNHAMWIEEKDYFCCQRTASDVLFLASYGAPFKNIVNFAKTMSQCYSELLTDAKRHCAFWVCGVQTDFNKFHGIWDNNCTRASFDEFLVQNRKLNFCKIIMQTGFKTIFCRENIRGFRNNAAFSTQLSQFKALHSSRPLSLKRLAANVIRKELYPNALVGSRVLGQISHGDKSPLIPLQVSSYITFGLTYENIDKTLDERWTI